MATLKKSMAKEYEMVRPKERSYFLELFYTSAHI
jgi:hypothetical protein